MSKVSSIVKNKCSLVALTALAASIFVFATPAEAEAGQFELGGAFGYVGEVHKDSDGMHGINFRLSAGYKFTDWVGLFLNQDLGGTFHKSNDVRTSHFLGATIVSGDFFYPIAAFRLMGTIGLGATYHGQGHIKADGHTHDVGSSDGAFAFRVGIGGHYMLSDALGVGLTFDYTLGAFEHWNDHILNLLLSVRFAL